MQLTEGNGVKGLNVSESDESNTFPLDIMLYLHSLVKYISVKSLLASEIIM